MQAGTAAASPFAMFRIELVLVLLVCWALSGLAEYDACTSIAVGRKATVEGSGIVTHNNDCATCDPRMAFIPARDHPEGSRRPVMPFQLQYPRFVGGDRSSTYAAVDGQEDTVPVGFIDQVEHTYAYWEAGYPLVNEHGLGFGESTCGGKLVGQSIMEGGEALFSVAELMKVAMERCKTAQCAIETMGFYGQTQGFYGEDPGTPGAGESLSVADGDETWVFHMTGGLNNKSATWVAQRVPDDHLAVVANNFIIQNVNCSDTANFMCSNNMFSNAREGNLCDFSSEAEFNWMRCFGQDVRVFHYNPVLPPIPYYTTLRMWRIHSLANPTATPLLTDNAFDLPFSVPVYKKLSRTDIMNMKRDYYKDTEFDMSRGVLAGPFGNPNRMEGGQGIMSVPGQFARGISIPRTSYSVVVETKPKPRNEQSIAWFATDQPLTSVYVPFFATANRSAEAYHKGRLESFTRDSAFWAFNFVSNWMNIDFQDMMEMHVAPAMATQTTRIMESVENLEAHWPSHVDAVNDAQTELQDHLVKSWWQLADDLVAHFSDGVYHYKNTTVKQMGYPAWWLQMIGFTSDFFRVQWVQFSYSPPAILLSSLPLSLRTDASSNFLASTLGGAAAGVGGFAPGLLCGMMIGGGVVGLLLQRTSRQSGLSVRLLVQ